MSKRVATVEIKNNYPDKPSHQEIIKRNVRALKATVFGIHKIKEQNGINYDNKGSSSGETKESDISPFNRLEREGKIVPPPFDLLTLAVMPENNTEIGPCIEAMAVNIESFGWILDPRIPVDENTSDDILKQLSEEQVLAENFFENCCINGESIEYLRELLRKDLEATGNSYVEFIEVPGTNELSGLNHLPSWTMRISTMDDEFTEYIDLQAKKSIRFTEIEDDLPDLEQELSINKQKINKEVNYKIDEVIRFKRFRRFVQVNENKIVWFKELDDPRLISCETGNVVSREQLLSEDPSGEIEPRYTLNLDKVIIKKGTIGFPVSKSANPVKHNRIYSTRSPYGLPRYIGHLFCIYGSRAAEEINFTTFKNNNVPNLAITITNGQLSDESVERIEEFVEASIQSDDNYSKMLLLEAEPVMEGMRDPGAMKIDITPLNKEQHTDAMFVNYQNANDDRTRRAWRFPPIFVGFSKDFTGKTIDASRKLADEQVFQPERDKVDRFFTKDVLLKLGIVWSTFKSRTPNVTENGDLVKLLAQGEKTGAITPRISRKLIGRVVNQDLGEIDPNILDPDKPYTQTLAELMKSNSTNEAEGGGELNSQGRAGLQVGDEDEKDRTEEYENDDRDE